MKKDVEDNLTDHEYDGIREYDNPLPMWWLATFLGTIIFAYIYCLHYMTGSGPTLTQELVTDMAQIEKHKQEHKRDGANEADLQKLAAAGGTEVKGREVFQAKCAVCHGPQLQGTIGPNLTDDYWIHGQGRLSDIADVVETGVTDKGMPAWGTMMSKEDVQAVAVFVASTKGSNPPNAKPPQGKKIGH